VRQGSNIPILTFPSARAGVTDALDIESGTRGTRGVGVRREGRASDQQREPWHQPHRPMRGIDVRRSRGDRDSCPRSAAQYREMGRGVLPEEGGQVCGGATSQLKAEWVLARDPSALLGCAALAMRSMQRVHSWRTLQACAGSSEYHAASAIGRVILAGPHVHVRRPLNYGSDGPDPPFRGAYLPVSLRFAPRPCFNVFPVRLRKFGKVSRYGSPSSILGPKSLRPFSGDRGCVGAQRVEGNHMERQRGLGQSTVPHPSPIHQTC